MAGYWIVRGGEINDEDALAEYGKLWPNIAKRFGAEIVAGKGRKETKEGTKFPRQLLVRFASYETALACYEDDEYKAAMVVAKRAYDRQLTIIEGD